MSNTKNAINKYDELEEIRIKQMDPKIKSKIDIIRKVLEQTSLDIDTSSLYTEMILASSTNDPIQKKLIYSYLRKYAVIKSDLAILCINTLQKDCCSEDPSIRGWALRSISSLNIPELPGYVIPILEKNLKDNSPYVRKIAAICVGKIYSYTKSIDTISTLLDILSNILYDTDVYVSINAILILNEIYCKDNGLQIDKKLLYYLLNRLNEYPNWAQSIIIKILSKYIPTDDDDKFDILNVLETKLYHTSHSIVIAAIEMSLKIAPSLPQIEYDIYARMLKPLVSYMSICDTGLEYTILPFLHILFEKVKSNMNIEINAQLISPTDLRSMISQKVETILACINSFNPARAITELLYLVRIDDETISRKAIQTIGKIGIECHEARGRCYKVLTQVLEFSGKPYKHSEAQISLHTLLYYYTPKEEDIQTLIDIASVIIDTCEPKSKIAFISILKNYDISMIEDYSDVLYGLKDGWLDVLDVETKVNLLTLLAQIYIVKQDIIKSLFIDVLNLSMHNEYSIYLIEKSYLYRNLLDDNKLKLLMDDRKINIGQKNNIHMKYIEERIGVLLQEFDKLSILPRVYYNRNIKKNPYRYATDNLKYPSDIDNNME